MTLRLILEEDGKQTEFKLNQSSATIGRTADNQIRVKSSMSSRQHCKVYRGDQGYIVQDLNSRNGTKVNGSTIKKHTLVVGDRIEIGDSYIHFGQVAEGGSRKSAAPKPKSSTKKSKTVGKGGLALKLMQPASPDQRKLDQFPFIIGSNDNCALKLSVAGVAGNHCMIMKANESYFVVDMGSATGTLVNGAKVAREDLVAGQILQLGDALIQVVAAAAGQAKPKAKISEPAEFDADDDDDEIEELTGMDFEDDEPDSSPKPIAKPSPKPKTKPKPKAAVSARKPKSKPPSRAVKKAPAKADMSDDGLGAQLSSIDIQVADRVAPAWLVAVQSILALAILIVIFGTAVTLLLQFLGQPKFENAAEGNLLSNWSFEEPMAADRSVPGWSLEASGDGADIDFVSLKGIRGANRQKLNNRALKMSVSAAQRASVKSEVFPVKGKQVVKASAQFSATGQGAYGLQLEFLDSREAVIAKPIVDVSRELGDQQLSGVASAPESATSVRLKIFAESFGSALECRCDRVELFINEKPDFERIEAKRNNLNVVSGRRGQLEIMRDNGNGFQSVVKNVTLGLVSSDQIKDGVWNNSPLNTLQAARTLGLPKPRKRGLRFRGEVFDPESSAWRKLVLDVEPIGSALLTRYRLDNPKSSKLNCELCFEIENYKSLGAVQLVDQDGRGDSVSNLFAQSEDKNAKAISVKLIAEIVLGRGAKKLSIRFAKPVSVLARRGEQQDRLTVKCLTEGFVTDKDVTCQFEVANSSAIEQARIRAIFARAQDAMEKDELEVAVQYYTKIIADFFDQKAKALATTRIEEIDKIVENELQALKLAARDLDSLEQDLILQNAEAKLKRLEKAFPKSKKTEEAKKIVERMRSSLRDKKLASKRAEALRLFNNAQSYRNKRQEALAKAILEQIVKSYPEDFRAVRDAKGILSRMGAN